MSLWEKFLLSGHSSLLNIYSDHICLCFEVENEFEQYI